MKYNIVIPHAGDNIDACKITKWHVQNSAKINRGDLLLTVETDKVACDIEATFSGVLSHQVNEGIAVKVGHAVGSIEYEESEIDEVIRELTENQGRGEEEVAGNKLLSIIYKFIQYFTMSLGVLYLIKLIAKWL